MHVYVYIKQDRQDMLDGIPKGGDSKTSAGTKAHRGLPKDPDWPEEAILWSRASAAAACKTFE
jgi:hypothetical protein